MNKELSVEIKKIISWNNSMHSGRECEFTYSSKEWFDGMCEKP